MSSAAANDDPNGCAHCLKPAGENSQRFTLAHWWNGECDVVICEQCMGELRARSPASTLIAPGTGRYGTVKFYAGEIVEIIAHNILTGRIVPLVSGSESLI